MLADILEAIVSFIAETVVDFCAALASSFGEDDKPPHKNIEDEQKPEPPAQEG